MSVARFGVTCLACALVGACGRGPAIPELGSGACIERKETRSGRRHAVTTTTWYVHGNEASEQTVERMLLDDPHARSEARRATVLARLRTPALILFSGIAVAGAITAFVGDSLDNRPVTIAGAASAGGGALFALIGGIISEEAGDARRHAIAIANADAGKDGCPP